MADTEAKGKKPEKSDKRPPKGDKPEAEQKAQKADKGGAAGKGEAAAKAPKKPEERVTPRLRTHFDEVVRKKLTEEFSYKNPMQVPVIEKVVINMGIGEGVNDRKKVDAAANDLALISGQKAVVTKARMYEFLDRLVNIALPRVRDFRGLSPKSFDGGGNYTIGIKEHIIFPEIDYDKAADVWGMDVTVCTSAKTDAEARALLTAFNFPFRQ